MEAAAAPDENEHSPHQQQLEISCNSEVMDLSGRGLRKLEKNELGGCRSLILNQNELSKLENIESYGNLRKLIARDNKFVRMYCVCRLIHLRELDLSNNNIVVVEGMRELIHLNVLKLAGNKIKAIEHLTTNITLEVLDLANNCISTLADISHLKMLRSLHLNNNNIKHLNSAPAHLPASLVCLHLDNNAICDLNQVSNLIHLSNLQDLTLANNPCIDLSKCPVGFDYRPFVISWCQALNLLDGYVVGSKESLKAEWLYSMGKGRQFRVGEQAELIDYLSNVCPLTSLEDLSSQEDVKLNRILKQRRQHQQQLMVEMAKEDASGSKARHSKSTASGEAPASKSALPIRAHTKSSALSPPIPSNPPTSTQAKSGQVNGIGSCEANDGAVMATDMASNDYHEQNGSYEHDATFYTTHKEDYPSDVPEPTHFYSPLESPVTSSPLVAETQYVPVPETMLSPDFRPISSSFHAGMYEVGDLSGDAVSAQQLPNSWASWTQSTSHSSYIPRNVSLQKPFSSKSSLRLSSDWPVAKRPAQVQRVQKTSRPVSLSPSSRRSPAPRHKSSPRPSTAPRPTRDKASVTANDSSSDSDVSMSKLVLVKEAAARKTKDSTPESKRKHPTIECKQRVEGANHINGHKAKAAAKTTAESNSKQNKSSVVVVKPECSPDEGAVKAAIRIQSAWRGYATRHKQREATAVRLEIRLRRAEDHVLALQKQLLTTQEELAHERRFRTLQMEAIKSLWSQMQQLQSSYQEEKGKKIANGSQ